jgi:hypothetical protein
MHKLKNLLLGATTRNSLSGGFFIQHCCKAFGQGFAGSINILNLRKWGFAYVNGAKEDSSGCSIFAIKIRNNELDLEGDIASRLFTKPQELQRGQRAWLQLQ